ncbi:MAG TPA: hypothetical protein VLY83_04705 [Methanoregula sp.]|nr:hypothetical protein [Methanoregula sp.]
MDPIENHSIGDVFFINGTTNLPVSDNLTITIVYLPYIRQTHPKSDLGPPNNEYVEIPNIPISYIQEGPNLWSANVTDFVKNFRSGEYNVDVHPYVDFACNTPGCAIPIADTNSVIQLSPASSSATSHVHQTTTQNTTPIQSTIPPIHLTIGAVIASPTTQPSPMPVILPVAIITLILILKSCYGKKHD